jgi:hypothetical protein
MCAISRNGSGTGIASTKSHSPRDVVEHLRHDLPKALLELGDHPRRELLVDQSAQLRVAGLALVDQAELDW